MVVLWFSFVVVIFWLLCYFVCGLVGLVVRLWCVEVDFVLVVLGGWLMLFL